MTQAIYVVPYKVNGIQIPARVQVTLARNYLNDVNGKFELPKTESLIDKSLPILREIIQQNYKLIIMYSHIMLCTMEGLSVLNEKILEGSSEKTFFYFTFSKKLMDEEELLNEIKLKLRHNKYAFKLENKALQKNS